MMIKGSEAIVKLLEEQGVDTVFGYPGGAVIPLFDALYNSKLNRVLTAHEQGAIHAADGYARASGNVGVCIATSGPGATNIVTGLATAYLDSIPVVAITGQVGVNMLGRDSFQEIDITGVTLSITKYNMLIRKKEDLIPGLRKAFRVAKEGRPGPVLVDVPSSIQNELLEYPELNAKARATTNVAREDYLAEIAEAINNAERPVLMVGGGAINSGAQAELIELAEKADIPVASSLMGLGAFPGSNKLSLGLSGMHGHIAANMAVSTADVLVVIGSRFSDRVTGDRNSYHGEKTIIQFEIDISEVDKNVEVDYSLVGDAKENLQKLLPLIKEAKHEMWWNQVLAWRATETRALTHVDRLTAPNVMEIMNNEFEGKDPIYVTDVGQNQMWAAQYLKIDKPRHFLTSGGCGTMGFGLPGALGASFVAGEHPVVSISGDGGFKMTGMELYTACRENKKLISVVINNSCLGMVRQWQHLFYDKRYSSTILTDFDFIGFAKSCGADGVRVTTCEEFKEALKQAQASDKTFVIEAIVEQGDMVDPMVAAGARINDFVDTFK
ncbi:MAG: biosynthetic-type acetolactate synthase large subunit [Phascolarctobacterium sp.]|nr:biosynthetic-type acetolactate synthase large subunit [Phascolarctobacterium sp.]